MFAILGAGGQVLYNRADSRVSKVAESFPENKSKSWFDSKWSPMKPLTDSEHAKMLEEKLLRVDADIALIDERIESLRTQERSLNAQSGEAQTRAPGTESK
jgi:hypothetical protein